METKPKRHRRTKAEMQALTELDRKAEIAKEKREYYYRVKKEEFEKKYYEDEAFHKFWLDRNNANAKKRTEELKQLRAFKMEVAQIVVPLWGTGREAASPPTPPVRVN